MERESAVREILQSIGPLFPEDAAKARAARKQQAEVAAATEAAAEDTAAPVPRFLTAPKPVLASQVDSPDTQKTEVANLATVLERLSSVPPPPSVREAVPELVRPAVPDVAALRAALNLRDPEPQPEPAPIVEPSRLPKSCPSSRHCLWSRPAQAVESPPLFTELPPEPADAPVADLETLEVIADDVVFEEPSPEEVQAALAEAVEALRDPSDRVAAEPLPPVTDFVEDEHDAFVGAIADAILPPRPYPAPVSEAAVSEHVAETEPVPEPVAKATPAAQPKSKFKRHKPKKVAAPAAEMTVAPADP